MAVSAPVKGGDHPGVASGRVARKAEGEVCDVSRFAEVIVIARDAEEVMEPLTRPDDSREWYQCFKPVYDRDFGAPSLRDSMGCFMWINEFMRMNWQGLLSHLESLNWPDPTSVQVLIHDEEDDCFGLWMIYDGKLVEVPLPRTVRTPDTRASVTGILTRTDRAGNG